MEETINPQTRRYSTYALFIVLGVVFYMGLKATKVHGQTNTPVETCVWPHVCNR